MLPCMLPPSVSIAPSTNWWRIVAYDRASNICNECLEKRKREQSGVVRAENSTMKSMGA